MEEYVKQEENGGKIGNLMEPGNQKEIKLMKTDGESNREDSGAIQLPKRKRCEYLKPNTDTTNDSLCNSSTGASKNNNNDKNTGGTATVTNTKTNTVTTNNEVNNREEAEADTTTNREKLNSSNNSIGSSNSKSNYVETEISKRPVENQNKMIVNNVVCNNRENPSATRESQQQQMWKSNDDS